MATVFSSDEESRLNLAPSGFDGQFSTAITNNRLPLGNLAVLNSREYLNWGVLVTCTAINVQTVYNSFCIFLQPRAVPVYLSEIFLKRFSWWTLFSVCNQ